MKKHYDVFGLGSVSVDYIGVAEHWPEEGDKVLLSGFSVHDGGLIGTALVAASRLGGRVCFAGKLGYSEAAQRAFSALEKEGIDTTFVLRREGCEPIVAFVISTPASAERTIFWTRQGVAHPFPGEFVDPHWYETITVLLIDHESGKPGVEAARIAYDHGVPVVIDVEQCVPSAGEAMWYASHIVVSEAFASTYTEREKIDEMLHALRVREDQTVIITRGKNGVVGLTGNDLFELPAYLVNVVDSTGCGDVFHGAYALALSQGQSVQDASQYASAASALSATQLGGRSGIPTAEQLAVFMSSRERS